MICYSNYPLIILSETSLDSSREVHIAVVVVVAAALVRRQFTHPLPRWCPLTSSYTNLYLHISASLALLTLSSSAIAVVAVVRYRYRAH